MKERELASRRREMESWDSLLREKDRKLSSEQKVIDEKMEKINGNEESMRSRELALERSMVDLKQREAEVAQQSALYNNTLHAIELRDVKSLEHSKKLRAWEEELTAKDGELHAWEAELIETQQRYADIEQREEELEEKVSKHDAAVSEFYDVKVAQITSRHKKEITNLEQTIAEQLKIVSNFQHELEKSKAEVSAKAQNMLQLEDQLKMVNSKARSMVKEEGAKENRPSLEDIFR